ncbi:MAG TPA: carboxypeptidase regulatory-like domain-containing protein [Opitutaceae bacterium]|nr:carboxypeptidase regulatory-like domain-containing protein [Opitutaceae bacterium]
MKNPPTFLARACAALATLVLLAASLRAQSATGAIEGRVLNSVTGDYVERARVTIEGTGIETFTDSGGHYRIAHAPAGEARLKIFFTGFEPQIAAVPVSPGGVARRDFNLGGDRPGSSEVVKLQEMVVSSSKQMSGAAIAINEQRFASNIMNVVSADEFGAVLENNVGDFLKFLPGITIDFIGGAARSVSIGGVPPEYVPITIGGFDLSTVSGGGTTRNVDFHTISMNNMGRIEVLHSPTAESPGSALAGSINMVPRSSFDYSRAEFRYSAFLMMRDNDRHLFEKTPGPRWVRTRKVHPGFDFSYIKPVNERFGFTLTGADTKQYTEEERTANTWRGVGSATTALSATAATQYPDTTPNNPYLTDYVVEDGGKHTQRRSLGATVDYKFGPHDRIGFAFEYALYDSPLNQRNVTFQVQRVAPGNFSPTFTHGEVGRGQMTTVSQSRHHSRRKLMPMLTYRHMGPVWRAEAGAAHSQEELAFRSIDKGYLNNISSLRTNVTINFDDNFYLRPGRISVFDGTTGAPVDPYNLNSFQLNTGNGTSSSTQDVKRSAYVNLGRNFDLQGSPLMLKGGLDIRQSIRDTRARTPSYTFTRENAAILLDEVFSERTAPYGFPKIQYVSTQEAFNYYRDNPGKATVNQTTLFTSEVAGSKRAQEVISSAYIRGDLGLLERRLKIVGGLRAEQTNDSAEGPLTDPTRNFQRDASGRVLRGPTGAILLIQPAGSLGAAQLTSVDRGSHVKKEYLRLFPSLNVSYNVRENLIARAAWYASVGRPNFNQYAGPVTLPDSEAAPSNSNRIVVSNAGIKAWSATTAKVRLEYYFEGIGQVSVGGFRREFENFFGSTVFPATPEFLALYDIDDATYGRYDVSTQYNIPGKVRMTGAELDYKQVLKFLPHWARGVQVFANATALRTTGDEDANFSGYVPRSYNWGASLSREKFNLRVNWNYRGLARGDPVAAGRSIAPGTFNWTSKLLFMDVQGEYYLRKRFAVFAAFRNVADATNDTKIYGPETPEVARFRQRTTYGSLWSFGMKGSF